MMHVPKYLNIGFGHHLIGIRIAHFAGPLAVVNARAVGCAGTKKQLESLDFGAIHAARYILEGEGELHLFAYAHGVPVHAHFECLLTPSRAHAQQAQHQPLDTGCKSELAHYQSFSIFFFLP